MPSAVTSLIAGLSLALTASPTLDVSLTSDSVMRQGHLQPKASPSDAAETHRLDGHTRYDTAAAVADHFRQRSDVVFVGSTESPSDVLVGSSRGAALNAPVLLVREDAVPSATVSALQRLSPREIVILGGAASVSDSVLGELKSLADSVQRIGGTDRYAVSAAVASEYPPTGGPVYLTGGTAYADSLTAGSLAGSEGAPLMVTPGDRLHGAIASELRRLRPSKVIVVGGPAAVSQKVANAAAAYATDTRAVRVSGPDRFATAAAVADRYRHPSDETYVASGASVDDALVAAAVSGSHDSPLLLTRRDKVPGPTAAALGQQQPPSIYVVGGPAAISDATVRSLAEIAEPPGEGPEPTPEVGYVEGWGYPTWQDEFEGRGSPDPARWNVRDRSTLGLLNDATVVRASQTQVRDGKVTIRGEWLPESEWQYTSAGPQGDGTLRAMKTGYLEHRATSGGDAIYSQRWGMWQYRVKMPMRQDASLGTLGAVWLRNGKTGEIDLTEGWGSGPRASGKSGWYSPQPKPNAGRTAFTVHSDTMGGGTKEAWTQPEAVHDEWAEYRFIYTPEQFSFYRRLEGQREWVEQFHLTPTSWRMLPGTLAGPTPTAQDHFAKLWSDTDAYDSPWHLRMNMHIGPSVDYYGVPDPENPDWTDNPVMEVDYVRIYQHRP